jgi:hypothetical protein
MFLTPSHPVTVSAMKICSGKMAPTNNSTNAL